MYNNIIADIGSILVNLINIYEICNIIIYKDIVRKIKKGGSNMYKALTIAQWFILKTNAERKALESEEFGAYEGITHLKLQKLLYYAQGICLALLGRPLFEEPILAWKHGPVVDEVYQEFKSYGSNPIEIELSESDEEEINKLDANSLNILELTYDNFAIYTAWQLRNMTHEDGTPWDITVMNDGINSEISLDSIKTYFEENVIDNG